MHNVRENEGRILLEMLDVLRNDAQGSSSITVHILAATDHDGVCAVKILDTLLQRRGVLNTIVPVTGNTEIIDHLNQFDEHAEVRSLVLLNCGASLDLQRQLDECQAPDLKCFVIDAHRPFLLANLSKRSPRVYVLDDDPIGQDMGIVPPVDDDSEESDGEGADGSDDEKENTWEPGRDRASQPGDQQAKKRRRMNDRQERMEERRIRRNEYYLNSYFATPTAMSLFKMAKQAAPLSQDLLWLAAVSLAGYQDLGLVSEMEYSRLAWEELNEALERSVDFSAFSSQSTGSTMPEPHSSAASDDERTTPSAPRRVPRSSMHRQRLRFERDLRLTLYKHWNLEESMMHSSYFYGRLELNRDKGLRSLKNFFATAGIPPSDYKQVYRGMQLTLRKNLMKRFTEYGKSYGLTDKMFLAQFVRDLGPMGEQNASLHLSEVSTTDAVHIVTALLSSVPPSLSGAFLDSLPQTADGRRDASAVHEMERQEMVDNFWSAYESVLCQEPNVLRRGIAQAVDVMKGVQSLARLLMDTKALRMTPGRHFRWCKVEMPPPQFRHHLTVRRLAVWLLHVLFAYRPKSDGPEKPLLVIMRDHVRDTYLCVGASSTKLSEQNEFGNWFRTVIRTDNTLKIRYDFFDKSCIEIAADDFDRFWQVMVDSL